MASSPISTMFPSTPFKYRERADSGFDSSSEDLTVDETAQSITITFIPAQGSSCVSLYPRTKTFTHKQAIDDESCLVTCERELLWRITKSSDERLTIERLVDDEVVELFKNCRVEAIPLTEDRRVSVGHYSSGYGTDIMPMRRVSMLLV